MGVSGLGLEGLTSDSAGGGGVPDSPLILQGFGVVGAPELAFLGDEDTGLYRPAADELGLVAGGIEVAQAKDHGGGMGVQLIIRPGAVQDAPLRPSLAFGDGDTGFYETVDDFFKLSIGGTNQWVWSSATLLGGLGGGTVAIRNIVSTGIIPNLHPASNDLDTGIGHSAADQLSLIAGGREIARAKEDGVGNDQFIIVQTSNTASIPSLAWGDGDTGFFESADDQLGLSMAGSQRWFFSGDLMGSLTGNGAGIRNETASASNPTVNARRSDDDTGLGSAAADQLDLIAGGLSCMSVRETAAARQIGFYTTAPISLQTGVAVTIGAVHAALVSLGLITA